MTGDKENRCKFAIVKRILPLIGILLLVSPTLAFASSIIIDQDWGWIEDWNEHKYVGKDDLQVNSHIQLSLAPVLYNYSNNYTFKFWPSEPDYKKEPENYLIRIFRNCRDVRLQRSFPTDINCTQGEELKEGIDFQSIEQRPWTSGEYKIRIFQNESFKDMWVNYDILINYKLDNFVQEKGSNRYFRLDRRCLNWGRSRLSGCPQRSPIRGNVIFDNSDFRLEGEPECGTRNYFLDRKREYLWTEGVYNTCEIRFVDVGEKETRTPLKWAAVGAFLGAIFGVLATHIFNRIVLKIIWPFIKNRFRGRRIPNRKKEGKYRYTYNQR